MRLLDKLRGTDLNLTMSGLGWTTGHGLVHGGSGAGIRMLGEREDPAQFQAGTAEGGHDESDDARELEA